MAAVATGVRSNTGGGSGRPDAGGQRHSTTHAAAFKPPGSPTTTHPRALPQQPRGAPDDAVTGGFKP
jgi:hypothetical protein